MKLIGVSNRRRAFSPVISAVILSAAVIVIGCIVWSFSQGATTIIAEDYAEGVIKMTETISERFIIEHASYDAEVLQVWIFNYGDVDIEVKVQVGDVTFPEDWIEVASKDMVRVTSMVLTAPPAPGEELDIKTYSRRGNNAYYVLTP